MIGSDILLLVTGSQLILLRLSESNSVVLLATLESPFTIKNAAVVIQASSRYSLFAMNSSSSSRVGIQANLDRAL